jgi:hypothetical protein
MKASAALGRGADDINNVGIGGEKRILYIYKPIEGAEAAESHCNRQSIYGAERLDRIPQANAAIGGVDANNDADDIDDGDVAPEPRSDIVAADEITSQRGADVPRGYNAGQRAVSGETGAGEKRGGRRRRGAAEDARMYKTIERRHGRREGDNIREHSE